MEVTNNLERRFKKKKTKGIDIHEVYYSLMIKHQNGRKNK